MAEVSKTQQQRAGWAIIAVALVAPLVLVALGVDLDAFVDTVIENFR